MQRKGKDPTPDFLVVRQVGSYIFVRWDDVDWIEGGGGGSVCISIAQEKYTFPHSITQMERRGNDRGFLRINPSTIVNVSRIESLESTPEGESLVLRDGRSFPVAPPYRDGLRQRLGL